MPSRPVIVALFTRAGTQFEISALPRHIIDPHYIWAQFMINDGVSSQMVQVVSVPPKMKHLQDLNTYKKTQK